MNSIRNRIFAALILAGVAPLIVVFITTKTLIESTHWASHQESIAEVNQQLSQHVAALMEGAANDLATLTTNPALASPDFDEEVALREMTRLAGVHRRFSDISLYSADGFLITTTVEKDASEDVPSVQEYSSPFESALHGERTILIPHRKLGATGLFLTVYLPVFIDGMPGERVVKARLSFERVLDLVVRSKVGHDGYTVLLDKWANVICSKDESAILTKFDERYSAEFWTLNPVGVYTDPTGKEFLYAANVLTDAETRVGSRWTVLSLRPLEEVTTFLDKTNLVLFIAASITFVLAVASTAVLSRLFAKPLERTSLAAQEVAEGNLNLSMSVEGPEEMRRLAIAFNRMVRDLREHRERLENLVANRTESLRQSQTELEKTTAQLRAAFNATKDAVLIAEPGGRIITANHRFFDFLGIEERRNLGLSVLELKEEMAQNFTDRGEFDKLWTEMTRDAGGTIEQEVSILNPKPRSLALYIAPVYGSQGKVIARLWMMRDVTEQRHLEEGLRQAQKMEAVGQLAGGVAHDFNNLLTGIIGNLALVQMELTDERQESTRHYLKLATQAGQRAAELIKQLLGFSRRSHLNLRSCDINEVLGDVRDLLVASFDPKVRIELELGDELYPAVADATQLEQVVMNMCVNAKDALPEGGTITMKSKNISISSREAAQIADAKSGEFLCISIEDNGTGMPSAVRQRIFEPFFTTKEQGKGTGLGLATSYGIVKQHGGWIECETEVGQGTRFDIYIPRNEAKAAGTGVAEAPVIESKACDETILIVDDEVVVRGVAEALLKKLGYKVLTAGDGEEALTIYKANSDVVDLIILDLTMPRLSGRDTFKRLRAELPFVPVLICSGYLVDLTTFEKEAGARPEGFIQKPYKMEDMKAIVREVLDNVAMEAA